MNICIITAHFPNYDSNEKRIYVTEFLTQYATHWVEQGHKVQVIHLMRKYPRAFYIGAKLLGRIGIKEFEKYIVPDQALIDSCYEYKNILINRVTFRKVVPHSAVDKNTAKSISKRIIKSIDTDTDIIIGDCFDPFLQTVNRIKHDYPNVKICQVVHNSDFIYSNNRIYKGIKLIDWWLLRSRSQMEPLKQYLNVSNISNYCYMYSGIEKNVINEAPQFRSEIKNLIFVGALYKNKGLGTIIESLNKSNNDKLTLTVVGAGEDEQYFRKMVDRFNLNERIAFIGKVPHSKVFDYMSNSDALVLISHETFGMVYVEAMSQGCIPIGVKDDGIDGVVNNQQNGYLVPLDDVTALANLFDSFKTINTDDVMRISQNAYITSQKLEISYLASSIINNIKE